jgi:hypothetical protein
MSRGYGFSFLVARVPSWQAVKHHLGREQAVSGLARLLPCCLVLDRCVQYQVDLVLNLVLPMAGAARAFAVTDYRTDYRPPPPSLSVSLRPSDRS